MASTSEYSGVYKVLFVCHGNICRSPMAEFIFKDIVRREGLEDVIGAASAGTSAEELGCTVYPEARAYLRRIGIDPGGKRARVITRADFDEFDLIVAMERYNVRNLARYCPPGGMEKVRLLLDFTDAPGDIEDPWYSGNFDRVGDRIRAGCEGLLRWIRERIL
ncbi:MAG: low molecular weight phosphotyrosine protein phosphatase [Clostridia bacterium]|nr:low molecular weight phosphotyrosine protein phosphatase [Clostridia bacterium]